MRFEIVTNILPALAPQGAYRSTGQPKIVNFSDLIPFSVSPICV